MSKIYPFTSRGAEGEERSASFSSINELLSDLRAGRMVLVLDDEDRENEGDLIMAAEYATPEAVAFMIRYSSGIICVPMEAERLARLELPQMVPNNDDAYRTAFTVSVDYRHGTTTGVSSSDRAATIQALAGNTAAARDFARPGHIFPLRPRRGGVLVRAGHTEAAVDLCQLAGLQPVGVLCELMNDDGTMARRPHVEQFARQHNLKIGTIADLIRHRLRYERSVERVSAEKVRTEFGEFDLYTYEDRVHESTHYALVHGPVDGSVTPLVRVHISDTLRDVLGIRGETKAWTLRAALERIMHAGSGVVVVLKEQESISTREPGGAVLRTYGVGAQILKDLGVRRMRVLSAPKQMLGISAFDLEIESYVSEDA
jgi:3,4-dihydroxy 2-butanone 4-phosphate synthase/GTP cyclohydrolase II